MIDPTARPDEIHTAESFYSRPEIRAQVPHRAMRLAARLGAARSFAEAHGADPPEVPAPGAELAWHLFGPEQINPPDPDEIEGEIVAFISEARWVANCPDSRCNAAQVVSPADPRYVCCVCGNIANHRRWYRVVFPAETTRKEVEQLLLARPRIEHMNWLPHETVADVRTLNTEQRAR